mgnify:CR=1 FL=1
MPETPDDDTLEADLRFDPPPDQGLLRARINDIPHGNDGWWHDDTGDALERLARDLMAKGLSEDDAVDVLSSAFHAAANEFGQ